MADGPATPADNGESTQTAPAVSILAPYSKRVVIKTILGAPDGGLSLVGQTLVVGGWVKTGREQGKGTFAFLELNDGSCPANLQVIVKAEVAAIGELVATGTCVRVEGELKRTPEGTKQLVEVHVSKVLHVGPCDAGVYPIAKTKLSLEYLRSVMHLRPRTNTIAAVARIRNALAFATHTFFQKHGFLYVHTPIVTTNDCEGAGEMFHVTTLIAETERREKALLENPPPTDADVAAAKDAVTAAGGAVKALKEAKASKEEIKAGVAELTKTKEALAALEARAKMRPGLPRKGEDGKGPVDFGADFFARQAFLTVSGQLQVETYACALSSVYTFGPTFRAENSHTTRHLAEFWMVEPEIAFADLEDDMKCAEDYVRFLCQWLLDNCHDDMRFMTKMFDKTALDRLAHVASSPFARVTYTEAIELLQEAIKKGKKFENAVEWGIDLASEHERYLAETHFKTPVIVYNYPKEIKAFYMRLNDDGKTVAAMDVLVPGVGELIGGSQREERYDVLVKRLEEMDLPRELYEWYLDLRKYGTVPHAGFGLGFERMILFATGIDNIRDAIPFPSLSTFLHSPPALPNRRHTLPPTLSLVAVAVPYASPHRRPRFLPLSLTLYSVVDHAPPPVAFASSHRRPRFLPPSPLLPPTVAFASSNRRFRFLPPSPSLPPTVALASSHRRPRFLPPSPSLPPTVALASSHRRPRFLPPSPSLPPTVALASSHPPLHSAVVITSLPITFTLFVTRRLSLSPYSTFTTPTVVHGYHPTLEPFSFSHILPSPLLLAHTKRRDVWRLGAGLPPPYHSPTHSFFHPPASLPPCHSSFQTATFRASFSPPFRLTHLSSPNLILTSSHPPFSPSTLQPLRSSSLRLTLLFSHPPILPLFPPPSLPPVLPSSLPFFLSSTLCPTLCFSVFFPSLSPFLPPFISSSLPPFLLVSLAHFSLLIFPVPCVPRCHPPFLSASSLPLVNHSSAPFYPATPIHSYLVLGACFFTSPAPPALADAGTWGPLRAESEEAPCAEGRREEQRCASATAESEEGGIEPGGGLPSRAAGNPPLLLTAHGAAAAPHALHCKERTRRRTTGAHAAAPLRRPTRLVLGEAAQHHCPLLPPQAPPMECEQQGAAEAATGKGTAEMGVAARGAAASATTGGNSALHPSSPPDCCPPAAPLSSSSCSRVLTKGPSPGDSSPSLHFKSEFPLGSLLSRFSLMRLSRKKLLLALFTFLLRTHFLSLPLSPVSLCFPFFHPNSKNAVGVGGCECCWWRSCCPGGDGDGACSASAPADSAGAPSDAISLMPLVMQPRLMELSGEHLPLSGLPPLLFSFRHLVLGFPSLRS
ncbi:unnamed protein product [Closterium sp. Naga37s-1]|nr:unnamed protein product [Closterium sp. Naga37s-1]